MYFLNCFYKSIKYIVLFQGIWLAFILPYCYGNKQAGEEFICFALTDRNVATAHTYLPATLVFVVMLLIFFWAGKKKKFHVIMLVLLVTAGYKYCYNAYNWDILTQKENEKKIDTVYQVLGSGELGKRTTDGQTLWAGFKWSGGSSGVLSVTVLFCRL